MEDTLTLCALAMQFRRLYVLQNSLVLVMVTKEFGKLGDSYELQQRAMSAVASWGFAPKSVSDVGCMYIEDGCVKKKFEVSW